MINIEDLKRDLVEYNLYYLLEDVRYGEYELTILNAGDKVIIAVYDNWGSAAWAMDKDEFLNIGTTEELERHINDIIYYNYVEYDQ